MMKGFFIEEWVFGLMFISCIVLVCTFSGCNTAYKPNVNIENAEIQHQSGNSAHLKGEYNAK